MSRRSILLVQLPIPPARLMGSKRLIVLSTAHLWAALGLKWIAAVGEYAALAR